GCSVEPERASGPQSSDHARGTGQCHEGADFREGRRCAGAPRMFVQDAPDVNVSSMIGLAIMIVSETATLAGIEPFASWNTPIAWTGFILFADGMVFRARGHSWLRSSPREFAFLTLVSIPLWLVFEFFNLYLNNWYYTGLPESFALRLFGYAWSFATIWPAIFEAADLIGVWRGRRKRLDMRHRYW